MIYRNITYFGKPAVVACDAQCSKAWGNNSRPRIEFDDGDDFVYLADDELGDAPVDPGTYEGGFGKPTSSDEWLNKWCARECERSCLADRIEEARLPCYHERLYNMPWKHAIEIK